MVGIFSKFSASRSGHRRAQIALEVIPPNDAADVSASDTSHDIELAIEFKPVEHPIEHLDSDQPVHCPPIEPSILNDGAVWKERVSAASMRRRTDSSVRNEGTTDSDGSVRANAHRRLPIGCFHIHKVHLSITSLTCWKNVTHLITS